MLLSKGRQIMDCMEAHHALVVESYDKFCLFIDEYLERGPSEKAVNLCREIDLIERQADAKRREIVSAFLTGALLAQTRTEILQLAESVDNIANKAQDVSRMLIYEKVVLPAELIPRISDMARLTQKQLQVLTTAIGALFNNYDLLLKEPSILHQIKELESMVDADEQGLIKDLFSRDIPLAEKLHTKEYISKIADISDLIEDIADAIQVMVVFRKV